MKNGAMRAVFGLLLLSALSALPSCGKSPEEQCTDLIADVCARVPDCAASSGLTEAICKQQVAALIPCGRAVDVTSSYDECITEINTFSCTTLFPNNTLVLPANCMGVIQIE